jgi:DNA-binding NarL/FixJ family response regulator
MTTRWYAAGFCRLLEDEARIKVVGEAGDGREAIQLVRELEPKVVLMDLAMPDMNGLEANKEDSRNVS